MAARGMDVSFDEIYIYTYTYIHIYIYACTHTHTHTHTYAWGGCRDLVRRARGVGGEEGHEVEELLEVVL